MITLYNTLTREKELFNPIEKNLVRMYTCGPTVYSYAHIGNLRTYIFEDILKRTMLFNGFKVKHVMNITDVGHLTTDDDGGEDKMEKSSRLEGKSAYEIAEHYTKVFRNDIKSLNIIGPDLWVKATDHIEEMKKWIRKLIDLCYVYEIEDGIYFDTSKLNDYGKLDANNIKGIEAGKRIAIRGKKNPTDFALWKYSPEGENIQMEWEFHGRKGFPGWHIECSVMATKYLGNQFDIHCGGIDHMHIHHTNEIAQTEAVTGKKWVNYWMHGEFLVFDSNKMSKSLGNIVTLKTLGAEGYEPMVYRYFCLNTCYRKRLLFSYENLASAKIAFERMRKIILDIRNKYDSIGDIEMCKNKFLEHINDDLNIPKAISVLWEALRSDTLGSKEKYKLALECDKVLGLNLQSVKDDIHIPIHVQKLIDDRETARRNKDWKKADELREQLEEIGLTVEDTGQGTRVRKNNNVEI